MTSSSIQFSNQQLRRLFPYYLLVNDNLQIQACGDALAGFGINAGDSLAAHFQLASGDSHTLNPAYLTTPGEKEITLHAVKNYDFILKGTVEAIAEKKGCFFIAATLLQPAAIEQPVTSQETDKYRHIIANMNLGLVETGLDQKIRYVNKNICQMSGYKEEEVIGKDVWEFFLFNIPQEVARKINDRRKNGDSGSYEVLIKNKQGADCYWLVSAGPLYNDKGEVVGTIGIQMDVTMQKKLEEEAARAQKEMERSVHAKEIFLANMSHEIRTPMNAILGMGKQLEKTAPTSQQQVYINAINTSVNNLLVIINDILDFSKIEAGKVDLENIGFDIRSLIQHAEHMVSYNAREKGLILSTYIDKRVEKYLLGDPYRINQVLTNLLSNAVKFTKKGKITINCGLLSHGAYYQKIQLRVHDTGIGMSKKFINSLFQPFEQEHNSTERNYGGTGLGMSITKQLVELMGGTISIESNTANGTTVTVNLDLMKGAATDLPQKEEPIADLTILAGKHILLVEDNAMNRLLADVVLSQYGATITEANNGEEALKLLGTQAFDAVLMDVQMPVMDGLEATRRIREELLLSVPIIALTANAIKGEQEKCISAGMNDTITKPFSEESLIRKIVKWIAHSPASDTSPAEAPQNQSYYSLSKLRDISQGNEVFVERMIDIFLAEMPDSVAQIVTAYHENKLDVVSAVAHRIRPSIYSMEIEMLREEIAQIEILASHNQKSPELSALIQKLDTVIKTVIQQMNERTGLNRQLVA